MKVLEINSPINLTTDEVLAPGAIAIIYQGGQNTFDKKIIKGVEYIPYAVIISVYVSLAAYLKLQVQPQPPLTIKDFRTTFTDVLITVDDYENVSNEEILISIAYDQLNAVYPNKVTILNL